MSRQSILTLRQSLAWTGDFRLQESISCRDRVWGKGQEGLCHDREFDVATELLEIVSR